MEIVFLMIVIALIIAIILGTLYLLCWPYCKGSTRSEYVLANGSNGGPGVTVTTQHVSATPVVQPPYPVDNQSRPPGVAQPPYPSQPAHPLPHTYPPPVGTAPHAPVGVAPYPTAGAPYPPGPTPYPPTGPTPYPPTSAPSPYPPAVAPPARNDSDHPPSYFEAVGQPHSGGISREAYSKQAPYNPDYQ